MWYWLPDYMPLLLHGLGLTIQLLVLSVIFGMIFNTALGMFYALGRRLTRDHANLTANDLTPLRDAGHEVIVSDLAGNDITGASDPFLLVQDRIGYTPVLAAQEAMIAAIGNARDDGTRLLVVRGAGAGFAIGHHLAVFGVDRVALQVFCLVQHRPISSKP